jgi:hypothetical protein
MAYMPEPRFGPDYFSPCSLDLFMSNQYYLMKSNARAWKKKFEGFRIELKANL